MDRLTSMSVFAKVAEVGSLQPSPMRSVYPHPWSASMCGSRGSPRRPSDQQNDATQTLTDFGGLL